MRPYLRAIAVILAGLSAFSANAADDKPTGPRAKWLAEQQHFLRENILRMDWKQTADGLQYLPPRNRAPEGTPQPTANAVVTVNYEGKLVNGKVFDSSYARKQPATLSLREVVPGWQEAIPMMRVGETWFFALPAALGYGAEEQPPIPPNSVLFFRIELLRIDNSR